MTWDNNHIPKLFRDFNIGWEIVKNLGLTPLLYGEIFVLQISNQFCRKMIDVSGKLENVSIWLKHFCFELISIVGRKVIKNHELTVFLFSEIFELDISNQFCSKITRMSSKCQYMVQTVRFWGYFVSLKLVEKSWKIIG